MVTEDFTNESRDAIHAAVRLAGGSIYLTKPPNIMVGRIPVLLHPALVGKHGIRAIYSQPVDLAELNLASENARGGVRFFNWVVSGERAAEEERVKHITPGLNTLGEHVFMPFLGASAHKMTKPMSGHWPNASMVGIIGVDFFMVASTGAQVEWTWSSQHIYDVENRLHSSLYWWADIAAVMQISPTVIFVSDVKYPWSSAQQVPFEPVRRSHEQDFDWIGLITANHGVTTGSNTESRILAYIDLMLWRYKTNYAFPLFVAYNPPELNAPARFAMGSDKRELCAYATRGLFVQMLFSNCYEHPIGWPPEKIGYVAAHEIPHVFWACDENFQECQHDGCLSCYYGKDGPRPNQDNYNCDACPVSVQTQCIMDAKDINENTWVNHSTCGITRLQIGWPY